MESTDSHERISSMCTALVKEHGLLMCEEEPGFANNIQTEETQMYVEISCTYVHMRAHISVIY